MRNARSFVLAVGLAAAIVAACSPRSSDSVPVVDAGPQPTTVCDTCVAGACKDQNAACNADPECAAINACVAATSPCVGSRQDDPLCDDDCFKTVCADQHPKGISLFSAAQTCQSGAQCGVCATPCASAISQGKCVLNQVCDFANPTPDSCKCSPLDGGLDGARDVGPTTDATGSCASPTCGLASAADVNTALGTGITGPVVTNKSSGGLQQARCDYDPDAGAINEPHSVQIIYTFPVDMSFYTAGRAAFDAVATSPTQTITGLGDAAFVGTMTAQGISVQAVVVLSGCVQMEIVSDASAGAITGLARQILKKL